MPAPTRSFYLRPKTGFHFVRNHLKLRFRNNNFFELEYNLSHCMQYRSCSELFYWRLLCKPAQRKEDL